MSFLKGYFSDRQLEANLSLKERQLDLSDRDAELKQRKFESEQAQIDLEEQGRYVGAYMAGKTQEQQKAGYPLLLEMAQEDGYFSDLPKEWSPEIHQRIAFMHKTLPQDIERAKLDFDKQHKIEKLDLEKEQFELKRQESLTPNSSDIQIVRTEDGIYRYNKKTQDINLLKDKQGQPLRPQDTRTVVNTGQQLEKEEQKQLGKIYAKKYETITNAGDQARRGIETLQTLQQAVSNPDASQGSFGTIRAEAKKLADLFNINVKGLEDDAIINAVGNKLALQLRNPKGEDGGLTGATSDRDLRFLVAGVPNRNKTQSQNLALIEIGLRDKARTIKLRNLADKYIEENGTFRGFNKVKKEFYEQNPLFSDGEDKNKIKNMLKGEMPQNKGEIKFLGFE